MTSHATGVVLRIVPGRDALDLACLIDDPFPGNEATLARREQRAVDALHIVRQRSSG